MDGCAFACFTSTRFERIRNDVIGDRPAKLPGVNIGEAEMNAAKNSCVHSFIES